MADQAQELTNTPWWMRRDVPAIDTQAGTSPEHGIVARPSVWQRLFNPRVAKMADVMNLQYQANPLQEAQQFKIRTQQTADTIKRAMAYIGKPITDEEAINAAGAFGTGAIAGGVSSTQIGKQMEGTYDIAEHGPSARAIAGANEAKGLARKSIADLIGGMPEAESEAGIMGAKARTSVAKRLYNLGGLQEAVDRMALNNSAYRLSYNEPRQLARENIEAIGGLERAPATQELADQSLLRSLEEQGEGGSRQLSERISRNKLGVQDTMHDVLANTEGANILKEQRASRTPAVNDLLIPVQTKFNANYNPDDPKNARLFTPMMDANGNPVVNPLWSKSTMLQGMQGLYGSGAGGPMAGGPRQLPNGDIMFPPSAPATQTIQRPVVTPASGNNFNVTPAGGSGTPLPVATPSIAAPQSVRGDYYDNPINALRALGHGFMNLTGREMDANGNLVPKGYMLNPNPTGPAYIPKPAFQQ